MNLRLKIPRVHETWQLFVRRDVLGKEERLSGNSLCIRFAVDGQHAGTSSQKVEQTLWQQSDTTVNLHQSHEPLQKIMCCWRFGLFQDASFCRRLAGFQINFT